MNAERLIQLYDRVSDAPDAIPRLRRFILDLAVRGRLAGAFQDWKTTTLGQVGTWGSGGTPLKSHPEYYGGDIPWLVIGDLNDGLVTSAQSFITQKGLENSSAKIVEPGTVLIAMYGSIGKLGITGIRCATNQAIAFCVPHSSGVTKDYFFLLLKSLRETLLGKGQGVAQQNISQKILKAHEVRLPSLVEQHRIVAKVDELMTLCDSLEAEREKREATRDRLTTASLSRLTAPVVDEKQFKAHADFAIKVLPELTTRPDQINVLRQTILDLAVRGKLVEQDPNDEPASDLLARLKREKLSAHLEENLRCRPPVARADRSDLSIQIPGPWEFACFDDVFVIVSGVTKGQRITTDHMVTAPYLRVANVQRGYLDLSVVKSISVKLADIERYRLHYGDVLMTEGGDWDKVGRAAIWRDEIDNCIHQNHVFRIRPPSQEILSEWVVIVANSPTGRSFFERASKQTTNLASINMTQLRGCPLPLPPEAEQRRIVAKVDELMAVCDGIEKSLHGERNYRRQLLEVLMARAMNRTAMQAA